MPKKQEKTTVLLPISNFQGLNIERGILSRPINSFSRLENFDLVVPGVIRKVRGTKVLTTTPAAAAVVAFRDYQKTPLGAELLVVVDAKGALYKSGSVADPINLINVNNLYETGETLEEAPFIVALPFKEDADGDGQFDKVQYIVVTVGRWDYPKYWDGLNDDIWQLGIPNPGDSYTVPYQHSVVTPQILYTHASLGQIFRRSSPNSEDGIQVVNGRQYRASWYNPVTGHDSSLFPLSLAPIIIEGNPPNPPPNKSATKPGGTVYGTQQAPYLMSQPLFFDDLPDRTGSSYIIAPQPGYTRIRIWRTADGGQDFYLLPVVYNKDGQVVTDSNGAIDFDAEGLIYGFSTGNKVGPDETPLYDGFSPATSGIDGVDYPIWYNALGYDDTQNYTINGANFAGATSIAITLATLPCILKGQFTLPGNNTIYTIISISGSGLSRSFGITPILQETQSGGEVLNILFTRPVADQAMVIPYAETPGPNSDRQNDGPPKASWGAVYQNRLFLLNALDKTQLVYSRIGHYEDFPPDNVFRFVQSDYDPLTAILAGRQVGLVSEGADQRLVIGKTRSTAQVTGTDISNFAISSLFSETGIVHKRAAVVVEGFFVGLSRRGLMLLEDQRSMFIGSVIKDITDLIKLDEFGPCFAADRREGQLLLGIETTDTVTPPEDQINSVILMREPRYNPDGSLASPYSTITLPERLGVLQESGFGDVVRILLGAADGNIYQLFTGGLDASTGQGVVAYAETQLLPQDDKDSNKLFRRITLEGNPLNDDLTTDYNIYEGWFVQFSPDEGGIGAYWTALRPLWKETLIGLRCKSLKIRFIHNTEVTSSTQPELSNFLLEYEIVGEAR